VTEIDGGIRFECGPDYVRRIFKLLTSVAVACGELWCAVSVCWPDVSRWSSRWRPGEYGPFI